MQLITTLRTHGALPEVLPTDEAAAALNRKPQTLRKWACLEMARSAPSESTAAWRGGRPIFLALLHGEIA